MVFWGGNASTFLETVQIVRIGSFLQKVTCTSLKFGLFLKFYWKQFVEVNLILRIRQRNETEEDWRKRNCYCFHQEGNSSKSSVWKQDVNWTDFLFDENTCRHFKDNALRCRCED
ncbi:hypothetical protein C7M84_001087 [Penaeus vannamei]|uniref:Uncharacterized protein n=1 Tax=Penaeus vannamei TaxID=6689 RepID=A0A423TUS4_PENVA|nr:hypothetical protein C7M84_001087 [Penaeus vannamei]